MADVKPFSQYLAEAKKKYGATPNAIDLSGLKPAAAAPSGKQDTLSWFIDILSRPMRAVQNPINQGLNEVAKQLEAQQTGKPYDFAGGLGNVATAGVRGFFSNNIEDQPSGSELIEKTTDVIGQATDPRYENTQDNVNPWAKGIGGFVLDVGLDPLTYIPGAQIAKAGNVIAKGVKGAAAGATAAVAGTRLGKVAEQALEKGDIYQKIVAEAEAELAENAGKAQGLLDTTGRMMTKEEIAQAERASAPAPVTKPRTKKQVIEETKQVADDMAVSQKIVDNAADAADEAITMAKSGEKVPSFTENLAAKNADIAPLRGFSAEVQASRSAVPVWTVEDVPAKAMQWMREMRAAAAKDPKFVLEIPATATSGAVKWDAEYLAELPSKMNDLIKKATPESLKTARQIKKIWEQGYKAANPNPRAIEDLFADIKAATPVAKAKLAEIIGPKASEQLLKMNLPTFVKATDHLAEALSGKIELANPAKMTTSPEKFVREIMAHNDIEIPTIKSVQNKAESIVGTPEAAAIEAAVDADKKLDDVPELSNIPEANIRILMKNLTSFLEEFLSLKGPKYPYTTKSGVIRTAEELWEGLGKRPFELNEFDQYTLFKEVVRDLLDELKQIGYKESGYRRANEIYSQMLARIRDVAKWFDQRGVTMYIGVGEKKIPMDVSQILTILSDKSRRGLMNPVLMLVANLDTLAPLTNLERAVAKLLEKPDASIDQLVATLRKPVRTSEGVEPPPNVFNAPSGTKRKYGHYPTLPKNYKEIAKNSNGMLSWVKTGKINSRTKKPMYYLMIDTDKYATELATVIKQAGPKLAEQVNKNVEAALAREIAETHDLSVEKIAELLSFVKDPAKMAESLRQLPDLETAVYEKGSKSRATKQAQKNAADIVTKAINPQAVTSGKQAVKAESTIRNADDASLPDAKRQTKTRKAAVANSAKNIEADEKAAKEAIDAAKDPADGFGPGGTINDMVAYALAVGSHILNSHIGRMLNPLRRFFIADANAERTLPRLLAAKPTWAIGRANYQLQLRNIAASHGGVIPGTDTTYITQAWRNIASGNRADIAQSPEIAAAEEALLPAIREVFGLTDDSRVLESVFLRSGGTEVDMLAYMKKANIEFDFDLDLAKRTAKEQNISLAEAIMSQWGRVFADADRPLELLNDLHYAGSLIVMDKAIASSLLLVEGVTSSVPKKGFGLVPEDLNPLEHPFFAHLPAGTYIDAQYMTEIKRLEEFAMEARTFSGPLGTWLNQTYTPLLNVWKKGVTIYRPGHHVRNWASSESIQWLTEGNQHFTKSFGAAARVLAAQRSYKDIDWVAILQNFGKDIAQEGPGVTKMPTAGEVLFTSPKWGDVTVGRLYEAAERQGLFVEFKQAEDLLDDMTQASKVQKFSSVVGLENTKIEAVAKAFSEGQAHFNRLHHFTQILMKEAKSGKKFEDVIEAAAWKVKKHHPDSSLLASGEAKLRQVIPFYTWFRLTMPVLMQGIATQPGRFLVFPKAYYNGAIALGVDPYSMSDPFPQDQMFPQFLRDQMNGPVGEFNGDYYSFNPGIAYLDVLNQFVPDPVRGALGMTTPLIKVPAELIGGTQWQTGAKIKDISDYVDSSLPGINYLANLTGYSVTGSIYGTLSGQGLDQQLSVSKGDKTDTDKAVSLINWFTGLGIQNMSRQSYIDLAEIEKRNQAAREKAQEEGTARSPF